MKKIILIVLAIVFVATSVNAGWIGGAVNNALSGDGEGTKEGRQYRLSTYGNDVRVYEWTPLENPNVRCVFVAGSENSTGVACYEVKEKK